MTRDERPAPDVDATWEAFARRLDQLAVHGQIDWTAYGHALAEHRPLIEAAIRSGSPTDAALPTTTSATRVALIAYLRDTIADTALLIEDHRGGKETDKRWGWVADGILSALAASGSPEPVLDVAVCDAVFEEMAQRGWLMVPDGHGPRTFTNVFLEAYDRALANP